MVYGFVKQSNGQLASEALAQRPGLKVLYTSGYTENATCIMAASTLACCCSQNPTSARISHG